MLTIVVCDSVAVLGGQRRSTSSLQFPIPPDTQSDKQPLRKMTHYILFTPKLFLPLLRAVSNRALFVIINCTDFHYLPCLTPRNPLSGGFFCVKRVLHWLRLSSHSANKTEKSFFIRTLGK